MLKTVALSIVMIVALLAAFATNKSVSLDRLAQRMERVDVIPEETRSELRRLIERTTQNPKVAGLDNRNAAAVARIERAMQIKPAERAH